jgi:hypothetical protein
MATAAQRAAFPTYFHDLMAPGDPEITGKGKGKATDEPLTDHIAFTRSEYRKRFCEKVVETAQEVVENLMRDNSWQALFQHKVRCIP